MLNVENMENEIKTEDVQIFVEENSANNEDQTEDISVILSPEIVEILVNIDGLLLENNNELKILNEKINNHSEILNSNNYDSNSVMNDIHINTSYIIAFLFFFALCIVMKNVYSLFSQMF